MMSTDVFGKVHLGYLVIETEKFDDWRRFGRDAIGMHHDDTLPGVTRFRLDDNECRFLLQRGPAEDTTALGWEIDDHATFDTIEARARELVAAAAARTTQTANAGGNSTANTAGTTVAARADAARQGTGGDLRCSAGVVDTAALSLTA